MSGQSLDRQHWWVCVCTHCHHEGPLLNEAEARILSAFIATNGRGFDLTCSHCQSHALELQQRERRVDVSHGHHRVGN
jgi:hypothetical protein